MAQFLKNTDPRFHLVEAQTRWTIRLLILFVAAVISLAVWKQEWLRNSRKVTFTTPTSEGIAPGIAVRLSGFRIGKVISVTLAGPGQVHVEAIVFEKYAAHLGSDSSAMLRSENLISDRFIELSPGSDPDTKPFTEGITIPLSSEPGIGAMVDAFREEIRPVITEATEIASYLNDPKADLKRSIAEIRKLTETLNRETEPTLSGAREAVAAVDEMVTSFTDPDAKLQLALKNIETLTATLDEKIPLLIKEADLAVVNANALFTNADTFITDLQTLLDETAPDVPPMLSSGRDAVEKTDEMVDSVRSLWPLRKTLPPAGEKTLRPSHDQP